MDLDLFAACLPGLEPLLADELKALGAEPEPAAGGVEFYGSRDLLLRAHLHLGTASHLLLRAASFRCLNLAELERKVASLQWREWLQPSVPIAVHATAKKSRLYHTGAIEERVAKGIAGAMGIDVASKVKPLAPPKPKTSEQRSLSAAAKRGRGPNAKNPLPKYVAAAKVKAEADAAAAAIAAAAPPPPTPVQILAATVAGGPSAVAIAVRFVDDQCTISIDTASTPLHRRGYRLESSKAPLREDLAFALVKAAGFGPGSSLLDPFCGSGTIAIEAAMMAAGLPPGRLRSAPLQGLVIADDAAWTTLCASVPPPLSTRIEGTRIAASDRDAGAIEAATHNAQRAGVLAALELHCCSVSAAPWLEDPHNAPQPLLVATNPPFGVRIGMVQDLAPLYQTLGHRIAQLQNARLAVLAHDLRLCRRTGRPMKFAFATRHGGLGVTALVG